MGLNLEESGRVMVVDWTNVLIQMLCEVEAHQNRWCVYTNEQIGWFTWDRH